MDFRILGPLEVVHEGAMVEVGAPRLRLLLALLLARRGEGVSADRLIDDLWEGAPPDTARHTLQAYVYRLRRALGPEGWRLETRPLGYQLKVSPEELDAVRFLDLADEGRRALADGNPSAAGTLLQEALGVWRGPAFADLPHILALEPEQARLEGMRLLALEDSVEADLAAGRHGPLVEELELLLGEHPFRERLWGQLMVALYRSGRQADALAAFRRAQKTLGEGLGIEPSPWLSRLEEQILIHAEDLGEPEATELATPNNLPAPRTSFVGRDGEMADLVGLIATQRLITVIGPPGAGKTRLAIEAAARVLEDHPHGVWFVSLAEVDEPDLVASAIAAALGVWAPDSPSREALARHLGRRRLLLVLDNFEHLLGGVSLVSELLDTAPGLRVLVTSRGPLRLSGEQQYQLLPLSVPDAAEMGSDTDLNRFDSLALFAERARAIDPHFTLTAETAPLVAEVTGRVDGLPLAIELAAARLRLLPLDELARRLDDVLSILADGPADVPTRQQRLREAIAWSYHLLEAEEQTLFRRLGVFRGGFTLEAAALVALGGSDTDVLTGLSRLVEMSLVQGPSEPGPARYTMLETIRKYALEQLADEGEGELIAGRHAEHYSMLVAEAEPELKRIHQAEWLGRLENERANILAVLRWAKDSGRVDLGLTTAGSMWRFWQYQGPLTEGRLWLEHLLAASGDVSPAARAKCLIGLAGVCYWQADLDAAEEAYREVFDLVLDPDDWWLEFEAVTGLAATIACHRGRPEEALPLEERYRSVLGEHPEDVYARGYAAVTSGLIRLFLGDLEGSRRFHEPMVTVTSEMGERWLEGQTLHILGLTSLLEERHHRAEDELCRALDIAREASDLRGAALILERLGQAAVGTGELERGVVLTGAASLLRDEIGVGLTVEDFRWDIPDPRHVARDALSDTEIDVAWARGRSMSFDEALAYADIHGDTPAMSSG